MLLCRRENQSLKSQGLWFIVCYCNTRTQSHFKRQRLGEKQLDWLNPQSWNWWTFERCVFSLFNHQEASFSLEITVLVLRQHQFICSTKHEDDLPLMRGLLLSSWARDLHKPARLSTNMFTPESYSNNDKTYECMLLNYLIWLKDCKLTYMVRNGHVLKIFQCTRKLKLRCVIINLSRKMVDAPSTQFSMINEKKSVTAKPRACKVLFAVGTLKS